ncbi:MAG: 2-hydroxyacid dehydrogenase [Verrucomicrobiota bacterium]
MNTAVFSTKPYDRSSLEAASELRHQLRFFENRLRPETAKLAEDCPAICAFVNDDLSAETLAALAQQGVRWIAMRCAGFNNVDLPAAAAAGIRLARVPAYSPHAVAEHALALLLALNRRIHKAYQRVKEGNFTLHGLMGFDLHGKTIGVIGTGKIGEIFIQLLSGFGCRVLAHDPFENEAVKALGAEYVPLATLLDQSDVLSLHCPLLPQTHHLIDHQALEQVKPGLILLNTSRGALVDAQALIEALKSGKLGGVALDVYEEEAGLFFEDHSHHVITDDVLMRLTTFPNVLITSHQAFLTEEALRNIAETTVHNLDQFEQGGPLDHEVSG